VVGDLSFISLTLVVDALLGVTRPDGDLALMVKPQFEVGRERVGKGGVVRDPELWVTAVASVAEAAARRGWGTALVAPSPLPGPSGNVEFFVWLRRGPATMPSARRDAVVRAGIGASVAGEKVEP
jgi:23S rRNA (cytidine1920-2'-O)/16S rRNA (cytidine1409-2'-O)-methyltransferase